MAAVDFDATETPQDLVGALSLTAGTLYAGQNLSTFATLLFREAAATPGGGDRAFRVEAGGPFTLKPTGNPIWCWTDDPAGAPLILDESP